MQITADSMGVYTKVFSLSLYQNFDVIRQWSVQWCLTAGPAFLYSFYSISNVDEGPINSVTFMISWSYHRHRVDVTLKSKQ